MAPRIGMSSMRMHGPSWPVELTAATDSTRFGAELAGYREFAVRGSDAAVLSMLPLGVVHVIFQLSGTWHHRDLGEGGMWRARPPVFVGGPFNRGYHLSTPPGGRVFAIEFRPGGAASFFDVPISELRGGLIDPQELWGPRAGLFVHRVCSARSHRERVRIAEVFLTGWYRRRLISPVDEALRQIRLTAGRTTVAGLSRAVGLSVAQFRRRFTGTVGLSPKTYCRIERLRRVAAALRAAPTARLTEIAHRFEYFDQSHFVRDVRELTGRMPRRGPLFDMGEISPPVPGGQE